MSQTVIVAIHCDRDGCTGQFHAERGERLHDLRARAAREGWSLARGPLAVQLRDRVAPYDECPAPH